MAPRDDILDGLSLAADAVPARLNGAVPSFPEFAAKPPWWGGDLQTLRNYVVRRTGALARFPAERLWLPLADGSGDVLAAALHHPGGASAGPLVVLIHGLTGCEDSFYMRVSAFYHLARGRRVLRLNLRGAGPSRARCRFEYHAGRSEDLRDALAALDPALTDRGLALVGYSLGANMLLKFLAEYGRDFPIVAAASVSAPIDLAATAERIGAPRNALYQRWLLNRMKQGSVAGAAEVSPAERAAIRAARSIYEFDRDFAGPRYGYAGADDYYEDNMARRFVGAVAVPTVIIHAHDDPWIPIEPYLEVDWSANPRLTVLLPGSGGHVGFHGSGLRDAWHDDCIGRFIDAASGRG